MSHAAQKLMKTLIQSRRRQDESQLSRVATVTLRHGVTALAKKIFDCLID